MHNRLKELRLALGMSQAAISKQIGITGASWCRLESGERNITPRLIISLCSIFRVSEHWLLTGEGEMFEKETRAEEMGRLVAELMSDRPESFRTAFVSSMLRIPSESPVWDALAKAVREIADTLQKEENPED